MDSLEIISFNHDLLIDCGKKLGYSCHYAGVCYGFTMRWIEASLTNTQDCFHLRIQKIVSLYYFLNVYNIDSVETLDRSLFNSPEFCDIRAFYESLVLYQSPEDNFPLMGEKLSQIHMKKISKIASSDMIRACGGLITTEACRYQSVVFPSLEQNDFFKELELCIISSGYKAPVPFLISGAMGSGLHAIGLIFKPESKSWQWMDVNRFSAQNGKQNLDGFFSLLKDIGMNYFSMQPILPKQPEPGIDLDLCKDLIGRLNALTKIDPSANDLEKHAYLYLAVKNSHLNIVNDLLKQGINPNQLQPNNGGLAIFAAVQNRDLDIVEALLNAGANPNPDISIHGISPLYIATQDDHLGITEALLDKGANPNQSVQHNNGDTPLCMAAQKGNLEILEALLNEGADPNQATLNGLTPLLIAVQNRYISIVKTLLSHEALPNTTMTDDGCTPLMIAVQQRDLSIVEALLEDGANPNQEMCDGSTPFVVALQMGNIDVIQAFLNRKKIDTDETIRTGCLVYLLQSQEKRHFTMVEDVLPRKVNHVRLFYSKESNSLCEQSSKNDRKLAKRPRK